MSKPRPDMEKLVVTLEANTREFEKQMSALSAKVEKTFGRIEARIAKTEARLHDLRRDLVDTETRTRLLVG